MQSWPDQVLPRVAGDGPPLRLFDTATGEVRPTSPGQRATMYVCGITPYDATHMGHAATYVAFDLVNRMWRDAGHDVCYVQNVTDVDDPLLERAVASGQDWRALASSETEAFRADMTALRVLPPRWYIGAVESIPAIAEAVADLRSRGAVYDLDGDLYFPIAADRRFGDVSGLDRGTMRELFAERGGDPDRPGKRDPLDALLWQAARDGEPSWTTDLGQGRPGWHVECTAIAQEYLGVPFDVQGGGSDLAFPHHEMCASMGRVGADDDLFARHYVHAGMVGLDGHKMSKSRGNLVLVRDLRAQGADPMAIRLALLAHHYREDWEWTADDLPHAQARLDQWRRAIASPSGPPPDRVIAEIREALSDDLDAPAALTAVDRWAEQAVRGTGSDPEAPTQVKLAVDALLGVAL
ncbi:MAG: cysteine--1-D-myo-inosityl 2-amino-2-deoxy-alpha-D-glucopyranoside ligase [Candidatus Nanopelagicales bacterium]